MKGGPGTPATLALTAAGIAFVPREYRHDPGAASYGGEAAEALGVEPERVFKTLLVDVDGELVVGIVPVTGQLGLKELAAAVGGTELGEGRQGDGPQAERLGGSGRHALRPLLGPRGGCTGRRAPGRRRPRREGGV